MIRNYSDFCDSLLKSGFSMGGGNAKGIYTVLPFGWENQNGFDSPIRWHTGDSDTDPWVWRMRVLAERDDIAYSKLFFRVSGYITREWYPYFYAVRRNGKSFKEAYADGVISNTAKRIYDVISKNGECAFNELKARGGFDKKDGAAFERALTELQAGMFITMSGQTQKTNALGEPYGWNITVFTTTESFWEERGFAIPALDAETSFETIKKQILLLNPQATEKNIIKFIK